MNDTPELSTTRSRSLRVGEKKYWAAGTKKSEDTCNRVAFWVKFDTFRLQSRTVSRSSASYVTYLASGKSLGLSTVLLLKYMIPPKRRVVGRVKGSITPPPTSRSSTHAVNTRGFATLADEIYLEIVSQIPTVPIPTSESIHFESYPEIRRSRHETLLSLSQTSRSLRRFFWRYLWQRIEVREGMKFGDKGGTFGTLKDTRTRPSRDKYAIELVRQLEIVTIRNPHLAQYVK